MLKWMANDFFGCGCVYLLFSLEVVAPQGMLRFQVNLVVYRGRELSLCPTWRLNWWCTRFSASWITAAILILTLAI